VRGDWAQAITAVKTRADPSLRREPMAVPRRYRVMLALPQRKGNVSGGRAVPCDGSGGHHEQSPGRGAGGVGSRIN